MKKAMSKSHGGKRLGAGRPPTGKDPQVVLRMPSNLIATVDAWATSMEIMRSEAIRRLVEIGLTAAQPKQAPHARARKAHELAGKHLDRFADQSATAEEQARRKRRLLKGPEEFQEMRVDRPKPRR